MEKRTLLAVVLSVVVIVGGFILQNMFTPQPEYSETQTTSSEKSTVSEYDVSVSDDPVDSSGPSSSSSVAVSNKPVIEEEDTDVNEEEYTIETDVFTAVFSNKGGVIKSILLKEHMDNEEVLEMVNAGDSNATAFNMYFGENLIDSYFTVFRPNNDTIRFERQFFTTNESGEKIPFTLRKEYIFSPSEYMIELKISIENSVNALPNLNFGGYAYTLEYGPQIGPRFDVLDGRNEYRKYVAYYEGKLHNQKMNKTSRDVVVEERVSWAALVGKYFTVIGIPDANPYEIKFSEYDVEGVESSSIMYFSRPLIRSSSTEDTFYFYVGPKDPKMLDIYDSQQSNYFGLSGLNINMVIDKSILSWLEVALKWILTLFYSLVKNYGVAIIMMTIVIKAALFPLTHKSYESTAKMQAVQPKVNELKEKYKDNPQKMNAEMAELYKKEGVNPIGGCLPMLLQFPMFIAIYGLLNKHFELRGAMFIPGWITDLSAPESIATLPFTIPFNIGDQLRLLPIIYVGTQLLSSKIMQSGQASSNNQMKMMMYLMPAMFFFILYNVPSGLLVYWIMVNLLTTGQQFYTNKIKKKGKGPDTKKKR